MSRTDEHPGQPLALREICRWLLAGRRIGKRRPTVTDLAPEFGKAADVALDLWPAIRALTDSFERWLQDGQDADAEEACWRELGMVAALTQPSQHGLAVLQDMASMHAQGLARRHGLDDHEVAASVVERVRRGRQPSLTYSAKGSVWNALAYLQAALRRKVSDAASEQRESEVPPGTLRRWKARLRKMTPEQDPELYGLLWRRFNEALPTVQRLALEREVKDLLHRRRKHAPTALAGVSLLALAKKLDNMPKHRVETAFRKAKAAGNVEGTRDSAGRWCLSPAEVLVVRDLLRQ